MTDGTVASGPADRPVRVRQLPAGHKPPRCVGDTAGVCAALVIDTSGKQLTVATSDNTGAVPALLVTHNELPLVNVR